MRDTTDAVHNLVLSQKLTTLLGNFPEVKALLAFVNCLIYSWNLIPASFFKFESNDWMVIIILIADINQGKLYKYQNRTEQNNFQNWNLVQPRVSCTNLVPFRSNIIISDAIFVIPIKHRKHTLFYIVNGFVLVCIH